MSNDFDDRRIRHLEMIQAVIARLATNNAAHKNYCITLVAAAIGLAATIERPLISAIALIPVGVFALLDAQYLRVEKRYRDLYDRVRTEPMEQRPDFRLHTDKASAIPFLSVFFSWSIQGFYLPTFVGIILAIVVLGALHGSAIWPTV